MIAHLYARQLGLFPRSFARRGGRAQTGGGGNDAAHCRTRRAQARSRIAAMISIFAALNGSILTGARVPYAAARDGLFFRSAARVHPAFQHAGRVHSDAERVVRRAGALGQIRRAFRLRYFWQLDPLCDGHRIGFVLRRKRPDLPRPYRTIGYPVVPLLFLAGAVGTGNQYTLDQTKRIYRRNCLDFIGIAVLFLLARRRPGASQKVPAQSRRPWFRYAITPFVLVPEQNCLHCTYLFGVKSYG